GITLSAPGPLVASESSSTSIEPSCRCWRGESHSEGLAYGARALHHGGDLGFRNSVPSAEVSLEQFPDDIFGDATPGGGCNHTPGYIVPAAFDGFAENDGCRALPAAVYRGQHRQPLADCLRMARPVLPGRQ